MSVVIGFILVIIFYLCSMMGYYLYGKAEQNKEALFFAKELFFGLIGVVVCLLVMSLLI
ncbi:MAG: hypothetical protein ACRCSG_04910 [Cellulosilyticaceae bacterium]